MEYATVNNETDEIIQIKNYGNGWSPETVDHKYGPEFEERIIPVNDIADEGYDPATERLVEELTVHPTEVWRQNVAIPLTEDELNNNEQNQEMIDLLAKLEAGGNASQQDVNAALEFLLSQYF